MEIVTFVSARNPAALVNPYDRFIIDLKMESKKILATMLEYGLTSNDDRAPKEKIAQWANLPYGVVKRSTEKGEIRTAEEKAGFTVIKSKPSGKGGTWLTPEGVEVAKRIDRKILSHK